MQYKLGGNTMPLNPTQQNARIAEKLSKISPGVLTRTVHVPGEAPRRLAGVSQNGIFEF